MKKKKPKLSECRALILMEDQTHTLEFHIEHQVVAKMNNALWEKHEILKQRQAKIVSMNLQLLSFFPELRAKLKDLEFEVLQLTNPVEAHEEQEYQKQAEVDPVHAEIDQKNREAAKAEAELEALRKKSPSRTEKVKKLYQRISRKCHPDRTKDSTLHQLFNVSSMFLKQNDLNGMESLWFSIQEYLKALRHPEWLKKHLKFRRENIARELANLREQLAKQRMSTGWQYVELLNAGQLDTVKKGYEARMLERAKELEQEIEKLKAPKKPVSKFSFSTYQTRF